MKAASTAARALLTSALVIALAGCQHATRATAHVAHAADITRCDALPSDLVEPLAAVARTECAFARTMADRDFAAFGKFLAADTVFFGEQGALLGKAAVLENWHAFYSAPQAPFSWRPAHVLWDGDALAWSTGPVFDPAGHCVARFNSIWRRQADGHWRIAFDKGEAKCDPAWLKSTAP